MENSLSCQMNSSEMQASLLTLSICLRRFGSWFGSYKSKIETFILKFLKSQNTNLVKAAGETFLLLQQVSNKFDALLVLAALL